MCATSRPTPTLTLTPTSSSSSTTTTTTTTTVPPTAAGPFSPAPRPRRSVIEDRVRLGVRLGVFLLVLFTPAVAAAGPAPLVGFAESILTFLTDVLGPVLVGIGLAIVAISFVMGSREGVQKAILVLIGGGLLFSVGKVTAFLQSAAR